MPYSVGRLSAADDLKAPEHVMFSGTHFKLDLAITLDLKVLYVCAP